MQLSLYWKIFRRWWWLILLPAAAAGAYAGLTYRAPAPAYGLTLRYTAGQPQAAPANTIYDPNYYRWVTSEYIVAGLKDWVRTGAFAEAVSQELQTAGRTLPAGALAGALSSDGARSVLVIYLNWPNADDLPAIAQAVTRVLQTRNVEVFPQLGGQPAAVSALDQPVPGTVPPSLRARLDPGLKIVIGLAAGLALALLAHSLDPRVRDADDLDGLEVLGRIPRA